MGVQQRGANKGVQARIPLGCVYTIITAKDIAEEIEQVFPIKRSRQKKKQFSYEGSDGSYRLF